MSGRIRKRVSPKTIAKRKAASERWASYKKARAQATPKWADKDKIEEIYEACRTLTKKTRRKHQVDHIIPLRGKLVCGLHVENNLQILTKLANRSKSNKFDPH